MGKDEPFFEIFQFGGEHIVEVMHTVISNLSEKFEVPKNWSDDIMIPLYKGKVPRKDEVYGN